MLTSQSRQERLPGVIGDVGTQKPGQFCVDKGSEITPSQPGDFNSKNMFISGFWSHAPRRGCGACIQGPGDHCWCRAL